MLVVLVMMLLLLSISISSIFMEGDGKWISLCRNEPHEVHGKLLFCRRALTWALPVVNMGVGVG